MSYILIIAGGRDYQFTDQDRSALMDLVHRLKDKHKSVTIRTGGARGADAEGYQWALFVNDGRSAGPVVYVETPMMAKWKDIKHPEACPKEGRYGLYDACAGFRRNRDMAYGDARHQPANGVVLFPGGNGTQNMWEHAEAAGLDINDWREDYGSC